MLGWALGVGRALVGSVQSSARVGGGRGPDPSAVRKVLPQAFPELGAAG